MLELFTKREKYFQTVSDELKSISNLLCSVNSSEVDCCVLQKFLECCIKYEHWNTIAEYFCAWVKKSILAHCLYQSLTYPLEDCGSSYEKFAVAVHENIGNDLPMHHVTLLGQIGALLMMETFSNGHQRSALKILNVLHKYNINYYELQTPVYYMNSCKTYIQKLDDPFEVYVFPYSVAFTAVDICLYYRRSKDAFEILQSFAFLSPSEITNSNLKSYVTVRRFIYLMKLSQLFMGSEPLNRGMKVIRLLLDAAENDFSLEDLVDFAKELEEVYNHYLIFVLNMQQSKEAFELYQHSKGPLKDIFSIKPHVFRGLVVSFDQNGLKDEAKKLFHVGYSKGIYYIEKPDVEDTSWWLTIVSSWTKNEIKLAIELYIEMLFPVLFLRHSKSEEEWFPVKIKFQEDQQLSPAIFCLDEHSTHIEAAIKKVCTVLESLDSAIVWLEDTEEKSLIVRAELFYNYWKKIRSQEESSPTYLKLPVLNMKETLTENSVIKKLPQTSTFNKCDNVTAFKNSTGTSGFDSDKTSPSKGAQISPINSAKRSLSSEALRESFLSSTPPKCNRDLSPRKTISPKSLPCSTNAEKSDNNDHHNVVLKVFPTRNICPNLVSENKRVSADTLDSTLASRNNNYCKLDVVPTSSSSTNVCSVSSIETNTFTIAPLDSVNDQISSVLKESVENKDNLSLKNISLPKATKEFVAQETVAPKTTTNNSLKKLKTIKTKKIKITPNEKSKTALKVSKAIFLKKRFTTSKISLLNESKKPKLLMKTINVALDGSHSTSEQPSNTSDVPEKTVGNLKPSITPSKKLKTIFKVPKSITLKKANTAPMISQLNVNKKSKLLMDEKINIVFDGSRSISVASKQPSNTSVVSQKTIKNVKPSTTSNFQLFNQEEFEKITHFLNTKIRQKCKNLSPEEVQQKAIDLAKNFIIENNVQSKLDRKGMKLLFEFSDKNI